MDSLNVIGDINSRISYLSNKIDITSKSATIAFSYLYQKIEEVPNYTSEYKEDMNNINIKFSYYSNFITNNTNNIESIKSQLDNINNYKNEINIIKSELNNLKQLINQINQKFDSIINAPEGYLVIKKESTFDKIKNKISNFFYVIFHQKQIKEQKRLLEEKKKEEEQKRLEEEQKRKIAEQKKQEQSRQKIKELLKK